MAKGKPKLNSKTPASLDTNALMEDGFHDDLIAWFRDPDKSNMHYAVISYAVLRVEELEDGEAVATIQVRHFENTDLATLLAAYKKRTKNPVLPGDDTPNQLDLPVDGKSAGAGEK